MKFDVVCCMDMEGHFHVAATSNRMKVLKNLKYIEDGQYFKDLMDEEYHDLIDEDILKFSDEDWERFVSTFISRGRFERNTIEV